MNRRLLFRDQWHLSLINLGFAAVFWLCPSFAQADPSDCTRFYTAALRDEFKSTKITSLQSFLRELYCERTSAKRVSDEQFKTMIEAVPIGFSSSRIAEQRQEFCDLKLINLDEQKMLTMASSIIPQGRAEALGALYNECVITGAGGLSAILGPKPSAQIPMGSPFTINLFWLPRSQNDPVPTITGLTDADKNCTKRLVQIPAATQIILSCKRTTDAESNIIIHTTNGDKTITLLAPKVVSTGFLCPIGAICRQDRIIYLKRAISQNGVREHDRQTILKEQGFRDGAVVKVDFSLSATQPQPDAWQELYFEANDTSVQQEKSCKDNCTTQVFSMTRNPIIGMDQKLTVKFEMVRIQDKYASHPHVNIAGEIKICDTSLFACQ